MLSLMRTVCQRMGSTQICVAQEAAILPAVEACVCIGMMMQDCVHQSTVAEHYMCLSHSVRKLHVQFRVLARRLNGIHVDGDARPLTNVHDVERDVVWR